MVILSLAHNFHKILFDTKSEKCYKSSSFKGECQNLVVLASDSVKVFVKEREKLILEEERTILLDKKTNHSSSAF